MPALSKNDAAEKLAKVVEKATLSDLVEIFEELFPDDEPSSPPSANEVAKHVRKGLAAEEIVDLWNVVFPHDRNVWYDEEDDAIHYNEDVLEFAD